ncbi:transcriptional regulator [Agrobacterium vitis]|uniref:LexA family transcriptional regulator n=1 Tax=Rhizobium/Agrobacterium group TaxID=227290 RepID=UPI0012E8375C|nr:MULTISPECIES: S24 family peptidase [Rhizobium/Agrobacterium group]MCF1449415.1 LexA family transcriptional regulator [Allorhizobium ampelinum]MCF1492300.1 LexA family transcriptional regulator [Allorhizobium ampelinum]MVA45545.1 transcriptional regulator [Agrobacterium vitis]
MLRGQEHFERQERAKRLIEARKAAGLSGPKAIQERFPDWSINNYKAHESGRNGFGIADAKRYAKAFGVNLKWLQFGIGLADDADDDPVSVLDVPRISWVSAGQMGDQEQITDLSDYPTETAIDLPDGEWICLEVEGDSMNKISPPGSIIFVNLRDKRLVPNGLYVVADETGAATYKRYRPNDDPPFQPASYNNVEPPTFRGAVNVVGRVRRSLIEV